jgi:hypothetical protein
MGYIEELIIQESIQEALYTMEGMIGNPGQQAIFERYLSPAFISEAEASINTGEMQIPSFEYIEAVEIITQQGIEIVNRAHRRAQRLNTLLRLV